MRPSLVLLSLVLVVVSCRSRITGNQGNLEFSYVTDDDVIDFNKPIGVGARLKLRVAKAGTHGAVTLTKASSGSTGVLEVESFSGNELILKGTGPGTAIINVEAKAGNETLPDDITMTARVPEVLELSHTCVAGSEARYFADQNVLMPFELHMKNNQPVIGYGLYPVTVSPDGAAVLDTASTDQTFLHLRTSATPQTATVRSTIDMTSATMVLVQPADVTGGEFFSSPGTPYATLVNTTALYHVLPTVGGKRVCQPDLTTTVATSTPSVCDVSMTDAPANEPKGRFGWVSVRGKAVGFCDFTLTYPQGNAGAGVTVPLRVQVAQLVFPDGGSPDGG